MSAVNTLSERVARIDAFLEEARARGSVFGRSGREIQFGLTPVRPTEDSTLIDAVRKEQPERTLETGFAFGFSAMLFCKAMLENGVDAPRHVAIDPFQSAPAFDDAGLQACEAVGITDLVEFHPEGSQFVLPRLIEAGRRFDLIFIDGGHQFENAFMDVLFSIELIRPGGLILVDDMWMPAVRAAVDYAVKNLGAIHENYREPPPERPWWKRSKAPDPSEPTQDQTAFLRIPEERRARPWDDFVPFGWDW